MVVWLCEWGTLMGLIGVIIFFICFSIVSLVYDDKSIPLTITIAGFILSVFLVIGGIIAEISDKDVPIENYKENAVVVETYTTSRRVRRGRFRAWRTQYHIILESSELEEKHEFLVTEESFDRIENGAKVLLVTKEYTTKHTRKQMIEYDWEFGEIK